MSEQTMVSATAFAIISNLIAMAMLLYRATPPRLC